MEWQTVRTYPTRVIQLNGYTIERGYEGGTGLVQYRARSPHGTERHFSSLDSAMRACEAAMHKAKRADD